jgi:Ca-activated chloride channel family protein
VVTRARPAVLSELAQGVDGELVRLDQDQPHRVLAAAVERLRTREAEADRSVQKVERFPPFLWVAAALLVAGFCLSPWRRRAVVAALLVLVASGPAAAQQTDAAGPPPRAPAGVDLEDGHVAWWQRWIPGGSRRLAHEGLARWRHDDPEGAADAFAGAAELDPDNPVRAFDLGTAVAASGGLETAATLLERAHREGVPGAAYNAGTAALDAGQPGPAVRWLREALLAEPDNPDVKRNYELALRLLEQQEQQQQQQQEQQPQDPNQPQPTPTPQPDPQGAPPTPTPESANGLFQALDNAEAQAREAMRTPTPAQPPKVEKDG